MQEMNEMKSLVDETLQEAQKLVDLLRLDRNKNRVLINKVEKIISNLVLGSEFAQFYEDGKTGNIFKAFCAGSSASMLGGGLSGTTETPGKIILKDNKKMKMIRGMAGIISNYNKNSKLDNTNKNIENMTPEGVEGYVEYKGDVKDVLNQISGGLRSGLSYIGCSALEAVKSEPIEFIKITNSGLRESNSHGIHTL